MSRIETAPPSGSNLTSAPSDRRGALSWACRLRAEGREAAVQQLLEALREAVTSGTQLRQPFASAVPSDHELPALPAVPEVLRHPVFGIPSSNRLAPVPWLAGPRVLALGL